MSGTTRVSRYQKKHSPTSSSSSKIFKYDVTTIDTLGTKLRYQHNWSAVFLFLDSSACYEDWQCYNAITDLIKPNTYSDKTARSLCLKTVSQPLYSSTALALTSQQSHYTITTKYGHQKWIGTADGTTRQRCCSINRDCRPYDAWSVDSQWKRIPECFHDLRSSVVVDDLVAIGGTPGNTLVLLWLDTINQQT